MRRDVESLLASQNLASPVANMSAFASPLLSA